MKKTELLIFLLILFITSFANNPYHSDVLWVTTPDHYNWIYKTGEKPKITIAVYQYGMLLDGTEVNYSIAPDMLPAIKTGKITLKNGQATISIGTMKDPGFLDLQLDMTLKGEKYNHHIKVGFDPEKLEPYTKMPDDFDNFWQQALDDAKKCPMKVERTYVPEFSSGKVDCWLVKLQAYQKDSYVYGYLTMPKEKGKYPIVFSPPGAGIKPMDPMKDIFYAENGFIRFDMEIHGIRPNLDKETYKEISRAFGKQNNSYLVNGLDDKDSYYMKKVYLSCVRAIDYLTSLPEWDGKNVAVQGGSQGGALALITTALDSRITLCAANHPALSDMAAYKANRAGGYPHLFTKFSGMNTPKKLKTLPYFDVVNFARQIKVPVFMTWGYNDNTCPPTTSYVVYNTISSPKESLITPHTEHWISLTTRHYIMQWIKEHLK